MRQRRGIRLIARERVCHGLVCSEVKFRPGDALRTCHAGPAGFRMGYRPWRPLPGATLREVSAAVSGDVKKMENLPGCAEANKEAERLSPGDFDCGRGFEGSVVDFVGI